MSTFTARERRAAERVILRGCHLLLAHPAAVHYTQDARRWEGIEKRLRVVAGKYPRHGDCSSTATWLLWNGLTHVRGLSFPDVVNGAGWRAGYTGTIADHGRRVHLDRNIRLGDLILYGSGPPFEHVTVALGHGLCFSHGSEAGPFLLHIDYRPDRAEVRRFIP